MFSAHVSSDLLDAFLQGLPSAFFVTDGGRIVLANQRFADWLAQPYDSLMGRRQDDILTAALEHCLTTAADSDLDGRSERSVAFPDGMTRWLVIRQFHVPHGDGGGLATATVMTDRTEVRRIQEQLWQAQKMEAVGQLTGGVAHDFNNLLTVVLGNLEFASDLLADHPKVLRHLRVAQRAAERGARLIQRLLAFSGQQQLQATATDLNQLITEVTEFAKRTLPESIKVRTEFSGDNRRAMVDPAQLESAVLNLVVNARDAMPGGGELVVRAGSVWLSAAGAPSLPPGEYAVVGVRDTGTGMPPEVLRRIFEPFFTTKAKGKGTGLGLCMVQGFAKQSGGDIRIETAPGHGTEVAIYLPLARDDAPVNHAPAPAAAAADESPAGERTILIVEDDPEVRRYVTETLARLRFHILEAGTSDEAIVHLRREVTIDLLFTDVVLPGALNGVRLAQVARLLQPDIRVLLGSGYTDHAFDGDPADYNDFGLIRKPYGREAILRVVCDVLDHRNETSEYRRRRDRIAI